MAKPPLKAQQLAAQLLAQIRRGDLGADEWLPSERQLAATNQVGRSTARQALKLLGDTGTVEQVAGAGARVINATAGMTPSPLDGAAIQQDLRAIHEELQHVVDRLTAIETHTGLGASEG